MNATDADGYDDDGDGYDDDGDGDNNDFLRSKRRILSTNTN